MTSQVATPTGELRIMGRKGDTRSTWSKDNPAEVEAARAQYTGLVGKGFSAFRVEKNGGRGTRLDAFDPNAESIILVPPMAGG